MLRSHASQRSSLFDLLAQPADEPIAAGAVVAAGPERVAPLSVAQAGQQVARPPHILGRNPPPDELVVDLFGGQQRLVGPHVSERECAPVDDVASRSDTVFHLAAAVGVHLVVEKPLESLTTNVRGSEIIVSAVTAASSLEAARSVKKHATGQYFLDINSVSPGRKQQAAELLGTSARYIDVAVVAPALLLPLAACGATEMATAEGSAFLKSWPSASYSLYSYQFLVPDLKCFRITWPR